MGLMRKKLKNLLNCPKVFDTLNNRNNVKGGL